MYLHLGQSTVIRTKNIIGIFDIDNTTVMKGTRDYLSSAEKNGDVVNVSDELPKSFVVCSDGANGKKIYISQPAVSTLIRRLEKRDI